MRLIEVTVPAGPDEIFAVDSVVSIKAGAPVRLAGDKVGEILDVVDVTPHAIRLRIMLFEERAALRGGILPLELEDHPAAGPFVSITDLELAVEALVDTIRPIVDAIAATFETVAAGFADLLDRIPNLQGIVNPPRLPSSGFPALPPAKLPPVKDLRATIAPPKLPPRHYRRH